MPQYCSLRKSHKNGLYELDLRHTVWAFAKGTSATKRVYGRAWHCRVAARKLASNDTTLVHRPLSKT